VSLAVARRPPTPTICRCTATVGGTSTHGLPVPMMNILNGGAHADNNVDFQEFMMMPIGADTFSRGAAHGRRGLPRAEEGAEGKKLNTAVGDEGGFAPNLKSNAAALELILRGHQEGRLQAGRGDRLAWTLTPRQRVLQEGGRYVLEGRGQPDSAEHGRVLRRAAQRYPIVSIEDGLAEDDWAGWKR
jgi:enolase